jgi:hypothetical protein
MPGCSGEPVVTTSCAFLLLHARLRVQRAPGIPCALSSRRWWLAKLGRFHAARTRRCDIYVQRQCNGIAGLHPSPLWGGWRIVSAAIRCVGWGPVDTAHRHIAPTPASASLWPTLPTKGGGIRKSELGSTSRHMRGEVRNGRRASNGLLGGACRRARIRVARMRKCV